MSIKAVIFDLDGTLFDTERLISDCIVDAAAEQGWTIEMDTVIDCIGTNYKETERIIMKAMGNDFPFNEIIKIGQKKFNVHIEQNGIPFKSGVLRILDRLDELEVPYGLATSTRRSDVDKILNIAGISDRFTATIAGNEVEQGKPNPEIYYKIAQKLGVRADESLVFEDSSNGINAAANAGARVIWIPDIQEISEDIRERCYDEIGSLDAVCDRLGALLG